MRLDSLKVFVDTIFCDKYCCDIYYLAFLGEKYRNNNLYKTKVQIIANLYMKFTYREVCIHSLYLFLILKSMRIDLINYTSKCNPSFD